MRTTAGSFRERCGESVYLTMILLSGANSMSKRKLTEWDDRLMCGVESLSYDFAARAGTIRFPRGDCCDFRGCLRLFEGIDPGVVAIDTWSGDRPDTIYHKRGGEWV